MTFRLALSIFLRITMLIGIQKVTVFSPDGAYLAVAGGNEVRSSVTFPTFSYVALVVRLDVPRACIHQDTYRPG
jgi:hypothetical protein